jgi:oligogalacturonide lyase
MPLFSKPRQARGFFANRRGGSGRLSQVLLLKMKELSLIRALRGLLPVFVLASLSSQAAETPPKEWIDPDTGHRVVRLSDEPGSGSLYFHQNEFSKDGTKLIVSGPSGLWTVDLKTYANEKIVDGRVDVLMTGRKTGRIYYKKDGKVWASDVHTKEVSQIATLPTQFQTANVAVNCDETLLVATAVDPSLPAQPRDLPSEQAGSRLGPRWASGLPMVLYTLDVKTGKVAVIHRSNEWLNHLQCSPSDPSRILFCHEGPWHFNDRVWTIRTDGSGLTKVHTRTMAAEIAGHEFFNGDGSMIWYDLQTPRSLVFWLGGYDLKTGERTWYNLQRSEWSVHYNVSPDGKLFAGDGGGPGSVANHDGGGKLMNPPGNGQWIYLFRPHLQNVRMYAGAPQGLTRIGYFEAEKLVNLSKHDYKLEPNVAFTPDGKWLVFRSNMHGPSYAYAVEIAKAAGK